MKNQLTSILLLFALLVGINSCKKKDDEPAPASKVSWKLYKNQTGNPNADALQAQLKKDDLTISLYGTFDAEGDPNVINNAIVRRANNDTTCHILVNPLDHKLQAIFFEVNGQKLPTVYKFAFNSSDDSSFHLSVYDYNWSSETGILKFESTIACENGLYTNLPQFVGLKTTGLKGFTTNLVLIGSTLFLASTIWVTAPVVVAIAACPATHVVLSGYLLGDAIGEMMDSPPTAPPTPVSETPPADVPPTNPITPQITPVPKLPPSPCASTTITYTAIMNEDREIVIFAVSGGQAPYTYAVDNLNFQSSDRFTGPYQDKSFLLMVKDNKGCVTAKLKSLEKPISNSVIPFLTSHTWRAYEGTNGDGDNLGQLISQAVDQGPCQGTIFAEYFVDSFEFVFNADKNGIAREKYYEQAYDLDANCNRTPRPLFHNWNSDNIVWEWPGGDKLTITFKNGNVDEFDENETVEFKILSISSSLLELQAMYNGVPTGFRYKFK